MSETTERTVAVICADIDAGTPVPRGEAERVVRNIARHCRGPRAKTLPRLRLLEKIGFTVRRDPAGKVVAIESPANLVLEEPAARVLFGAPDGDAEPPADVEIDELLSDLFAIEERSLAGLVDQAARRFCGADVNDVILAAPLDGEHHAAACPRCGVDLSYTAPRIPLIEETT